MVKVLFISAFLLAVLGVVLMLWVKNKRSAPQKEIPGVEQMAKTISFWADWHRQKQKED